MGRGYKIFSRSQKFRDHFDETFGEKMMEKIFKTFICQNCGATILTIGNDTKIHIQWLSYECGNCGTAGKCEHILRDTIVSDPTLPEIEGEE